MTPAPAKTLRLERTFSASPVDLWTAWTDPRQYARWFNPAPGIDLVIHEYDVRPGGRVRFDMPQPDGNKNPQEGVFHVLTPFSRIVTGSPDRSFLLDVRFEPQGAERTRMVVEVTGVPPEYHSMATQGWNAGFDKLERVLREPRPVRDIVLERALDAAPERVFDAWTDPKKVARWFSPIPGVDADVHSFDARPGGTAHLTVKPPQGEPFGFHVKFLALKRPHELDLIVAPTEDFATPPMSVRLAAEGKGTRMRFVAPGVPEGVYKDAERGWSAFFDKLAAVVKGA